MQSASSAGAVQAVCLSEPQYEVIEGDMMVTGALPSSGGVEALHRRLCEQPEAVPSMSAFLPDARSAADSPATNGAAPQGEAPGGQRGGAYAPLERAAMSAQAQARRRRGSRGRVQFYKAWGEWGALSNFSPHAIDMPRALGAPSNTRSAARCRWPSVEHYYQAQKFTHAAACADADAVVDAILAAPSPEEAARQGRHKERAAPHLVRPDWPSAKVDVMAAALREKFERHAGPRRMLLSTEEGPQSAELVEASPHDAFWGSGRDGAGQNMLGVLLMRLRAELAAELDAGADGADAAQGVTERAAAG